MGVATRRAAVLFICGAALTAAALWVVLKVIPLASPKEMVRMQFEHPGPARAPLNLTSEPVSSEGLEPRSGGHQAAGVSDSGYLTVGFHTLASFPLTLSAPMLHVSRACRKGETPA